MIEDEFGHLEHADAILATKDFAQFVVGFDKCFILRVLKIMAADVIPQLLGDFSAGKGLIADDFAKLLVRLNRFQKSCARLSFGFGLCFGHKSTPS